MQRRSVAAFDCFRRKHGASIPPMQVLRRPKQRAQERKRSTSAPLTTADRPTKSSERGWPRESDDVTFAIDGYVAPIDHRLIHHEQEVANATTQTLQPADAN